MRKIISLGLFALMLSIFSGQVLAGNADKFCGPLKNKGIDNYVPGLYGLCVAWHNADENGRAAIAENYSKRGGGTIPGSLDFSCPCWKEVSRGDICALGVPNYYGVIAGIDYVFFSGDYFQASSSKCAYRGSFYDDVQLLSGSQTSSCLGELLEIAVVFDSEDCVFGD